MQLFFMTMHLQSQWRDPRIKPYNLSKLTPMDLHKDERWRTRDLPRIQDQGLWYPLALYKVCPYWWHNTYSCWRPTECYHIPPIINEDGMIWAVKMGSNRYQCAVHLGYETIDAIMFDNSDDCVKLTVWFRECDPLNNKNASAYNGTYGY